MTRPRRLWLVAPAKVNLGLEVTRRRADGYHELVTVFQAISLFDLFEWTATGSPFTYRGPLGVDQRDDLVARALECAPDRAVWTGELRVHKRIPLSAGLGGGSSDAALALRLALPDAAPDALHAHALELGADVPFFLRGGAALARGVGEQLSPLGSPGGWIVVVTPAFTLENKTATLYRGLLARDFSDGSRVEQIATTIADALPESLPNAFTRQLLMHESVRYAYDGLRRAGARNVTISGAGPTVFAHAADWREACAVARRVPAAAGRLALARTLAPRDDAQAVATLAAALRGAG